MKSTFAPGPVVLFGSGETSPSGRRVFEQVFARLHHAPQVMLLETPAGFEVNSEQVIGRVAAFLEHRLQNYAPQNRLIAARARGTSLSPDSPEITAPLLEADLIFMGPGSPSYAVRQLRDSLAWHYLTARHRLGAPLALASAAAIAASRYSLPVYEIYKVGEDPHWKEGLDFFGPYGLSLVFIPHWNNQDGGDELDTSRCFMGQERFTRLVELLPADITVLGIDEQTALIVDPSAGTCEVSGLGGVTVIHTGHGHSVSPEAARPQEGRLAEVAELLHGHVHQYGSGEVFPLTDLGPFRLPEPITGLPEGVWRQAQEAQARRILPETPADLEVPPEVLELVERRQEARARRDWAAADALREEIARLGWQLTDTPEGPQLEKL